MFAAADAAFDSCHDRLRHPHALGKLAARGAKLVLCARDAGDLARVREELVKRGAEVETFAGDLSREADARAKAFATKYYTADIHKGAASLPPFVAEALGE